MTNKLTKPAVQTQATVAELLRAAGLRFLDDPADWAQGTLTPQDIVTLLGGHATSSIESVITLAPTPELSKAAARLRDLGETEAADRVQEIADAGFFVDMRKAIANGSAHLIREISHDSKGRPRVKLVDSQTAATRLATIHGLVAGDQLQATTDVPAAQFWSRLFHQLSPGAVAEVGVAIERISKDQDRVVDITPSQSDER